MAAAIRALFLVALQASTVSALAVRKSAVESSARRGVVALHPATAFARRKIIMLLPATAFAPTSTSAVSPDGLEFKEQGGVQYADVSPGRGDAVVGKDSRVTVDLVGRLVGRQGWTFENTRDDDDPYRLSLGRGDVIEGLEAGLQGMRVGGVRRIVVPSALAYADRSQEPIPRSFAFQQRLYSTVLNDNRRTREAAALGADLVGKVMFDVKVLAIRPPR
jgi:FKBP-type peptidyl-prolyl cis-trans isomerase FkpA